MDTSLFCPASGLLSSWSSAFGVYCPSTSESSWVTSSWLLQELSSKSWDLLAQMTSKSLNSKLLEPFLTPCWSSCHCFLPTWLGRQTTLSSPFRFTGSRPSSRGGLPSVRYSRLERIRDRLEYFLGRLCLPRQPSTQGPVEVIAQIKITTNFTVIIIHSSIQEDLIYNTIITTIIQCLLWRMKTYFMPGIPLFITKVSLH